MTASTLEAPRAVRARPRYSALRGIRPSEARRLRGPLAWRRFDAIRAGLAAVIDELPHDHEARTVLDHAWWLLGDLRSELASFELEEARDD